MKHSTRAAWRLVPFVLAFSSAPTFAGIISGGFENGLVGWETFGDASAQSANIGIIPSQGQHQGVITTLCGGPSAGFCEGPVEMPYSATTAVDFLPKQVFPFLGLNYETDVSDLVRSLPAPDGFIADVNGSASAIAQDFFAYAGNTITFSLNEVTLDDNVDFGLISLVSQDPAFASKYVQLLTYGFNVPLGFPSNSDLCQHALRSSCDTPNESGWLDFALVIPVTGTYRLGFGVIERVEGNTPTLFAIDDLTLVPEPDTPALLSAGLLMLTVMQRRFRLLRVTDSR